MQKITPHLWFDKEAKEAAEFYAATFGGHSQIKNISELHDTPSGDVDIVNFELLGENFTAISAGPYFKFNPAISFIVVCKSIEEVEEHWRKLVEGGKVLMELGTYPFSPKYGWLEDKYGLSWQIILDDGHYPYKHKITPTLMFVGNVCGKGEEAMNFYASVFPDSKVGDIVRYPAGMEGEKEGTVMHGAVTLANQEFFIMDSGQKHEFNFNEAVSFMVNCKDQAEIDYYWEKLSAVPEAEQCGWLKDKYGVSWQVVPIDMDKMMKKGTPEQIARLTKAFLQMKKFNLAELERAYEGKE
jgi:predicted 3-demethylubiquinone-9 3-methyltransferase (glyoxalase superfamily)